MAITIGQLKAFLAEIPAECDDQEVYALSGFSDIPGWDREIGLPRQYREEPGLFFPLFGPRRPVSKEEFERVDRRWREFFERQMRAGTWPFTEARKEPDG